MHAQGVSRGGNGGEGGGLSCEQRKRGGEEKLPGPVSHANSKNNGRCWRRLREGM